MISYFIWIPSLVLSIFFMSWLSCKSDEGWKWFWYLFIAGSVFQFWPWVARYTNRMVFDAILYDSLAVVSWTLGLIYWSGGKFTSMQWIGAAIVMTGLIMIQKG